MTNFTKIRFKSFVIGVVALLAASTWTTTLQSQTEYTLTITTPASVAGNYALINASFGPAACSTDTVRGALALGTDSTGSSLACNRILNDLTGKIVLIDRGACDFTLKVRNAQARGAVAVIIINNAANGGGIFIPGGASSLVTIPAFGITLANGNALKAALTSGVNGVISRDDIVDAGTDIVVWGDTPGEGDFAGGLNGWTSNTISCFGPGPDTTKVWRWSADGSAQGGCTDAVLSSPTRCNGIVVFESDFYDNGGSACDATVFGKGPCPSPQVGELTSPNINVSTSNSPNDFVLRFYQSTRSFTDNQYLIAWSSDNGTTWDTTEINADITANNSSPVPSIQRVDLTGTAGADSLRVKFIWNANYYYWAIDDIQIVEKEANNLRVNPFFAIPQNAATPLAFVEPIGFLADIQNVGTAAQTNVNLNVSIENQQGAEVFSTDLSYGSVPAGALIENRRFPQQFTPTVRGTYFGTYNIDATATDSDTSNNSQDFTFIVTDTLFSKDLAGPSTALQPAADASWDANEPHSWAWGQYYYVPNAGNNYIRSVSFGITADSTVAGEEILINIYKWLDDTNEDEQADPDERLSLDFATYTIKGTERAGTLITVPFPDAGAAPVKLENNTAYLVMIEYYAVNNDNFFIAATDEIDYAAMILLNRDSLMRPRYAGMLGVNGNLDEEPYSTVGFGDGTGNVYRIQPVVRMSVGAALTATKEVNLLDNKFNVFPNPTSDILNVQLNLDQQAKTANVRLYDLSGRMLQQWSYDNIQKERFQYNLQNLNSGTYFLQVITEEGAGTKKFTIAK